MLKYFVLIRVLFLVGMTACEPPYGADNIGYYSLKIAASCLLNWNHLFRMIWGEVDASATIHIPGYGIC